MDQGAKLIVVDPRFTRSASKADLYVRLIRPGTDIALMGGLINYALENNLFHKDYVANYTNAAFIVNKDFGFQDGLFSGYGTKTKRAYDLKPGATSRTPRKSRYRPHPEQPPVRLPDHEEVLRPVHPGDWSADHRGRTKTQYPEDGGTFCATGQPGKAGTLLYAMGGTQHTTGVQIIRAIPSCSMLLGNMGIAGGGINALRGENNVQGSTDMACCSTSSPGYMAIPSEAAAPHPAKDYLDKETPRGQLLDQQAQVLRQPAQGLLGGRGHPGERLRLRLPAQDGQGLLGLGLLLDSAVRGPWEGEASRACWSGA